MADPGDRSAVCRPCDQCVNVSYWHTPQWPARTVGWTDERCPVCKLWVCDTCFDDHIWCGNDDVGMVADLAWLSEKRKQGDDAGADAYTAGMVDEMMTADWPASRNALSEQLNQSEQPNQPSKWQIVPTDDAS